MSKVTVGAAEALSDWGLEHPEERPDALATRLMDVVWTDLGHWNHVKR